MLHPQNRAKLGLLMVLIPALALMTEGAAAEEALAGIHVSGVGEVRVVPDMARVVLEVRREGMDAAALKTELDEVTAAVLELASELDIPERHVTAAAVNIHPRYRPHPEGQQPEGVIAVRAVEVTVEALDALPELINGALSRGANGVRDVQLDATNRPELEREALHLAIDDARQEARQVAARFEVNLGPLKDAVATSHEVHPLMRMNSTMEAGVAQDSFAPGELTIRREVQATFGIRR